MISTVFYKKNYVPTLQFRGSVRGVQGVILTPRFLNKAQLYPIDYWWVENGFSEFDPSIWVPNGAPAFRGWSHHLGLHPGSLYSLLMNLDDRLFWSTIINDKMCILYASWHNFVLKNTIFSGNHKRCEVTGLILQSPMQLTARACIHYGHFLQFCPKIMFERLSIGVTMQCNNVFIIKILYWV